MKRRQLNLVALAIVISCAGCSTYDNQTRAMQVQYAGQLAEAEEQSRRYDEQMDKGDEQSKRYDELLRRWEEQADRFDVILDKWEKSVPAREHASRR